MESISGENVQAKQGDPLLIELVSQFPCLYNKALKEYRNNSFREGAWAAIAECMNITPSECTKRWGQLRDNFGREKRRREEESRSGSGLSQRRGFSFFEEMRFLEQHVHKRRTFSNVQNPSDASFAGFGDNSQLTSGCFSITSPNVMASLQSATVEENLGMAQSTFPLLHPAGPAPSPPVAITSSSSSTLMPTFVSGTRQRFIEATGLIDAPSPATISNRFPPAATTTTDVPISMLMLPPCVITPTLSPMESVTTSSPLDTTTDSPVSSLVLPPPATTPTPPPIVPTPPPIVPTSLSIVPTTFHSPDPSTRSSFSETPTSPPLMITTEHHTTSSCSTASISPSLSVSSTQSSTPTAMSQTNNQWYSVPSPEISPSSCFKVGRRPTSSNNRSSLGSNIQATSCFNKKTEKQKKNDPIESSFLSLSATIQEHLTNRIRTHENTKDNISASRGEEAFANLVTAELANLNEQKRAIKKAKILKVLYEEEE